MSLLSLVAVFQQSEATLAARLVLLALADHAHDDGSNAFPSVGTLAKKARVSERSVQRCLRELEQLCEIVRVTTTAKGVAVYHLTVVQPLSVEVAPDRGGDNLTPEVLRSKEPLRGRFGRQDVTPGATERRPPGDAVSPRVRRWIEANHATVGTEAARDIFAAVLELDGDELERAVAAHDQRRREAA